MASGPDQGALSPAEPAAESHFRHYVLLGNSPCKGLIMEQLEIIDLGDVMTETQCSMVFASSYDSFYGPGHRVFC